MKLISLKIKGFKNLDLWDTPIDFTKSEGISVFVGNNGSGKSNVLEAISAIFYGLYNKKNFDPNFNFELIYEITKEGLQLPATLPASLINTYEVKILHEDSFLSFYINGKNEELNHKQIDFYLPNQVIALYSGEETRLYENYYLKEYEDYISSIIHGKRFLQDSIQMNFVSKELWDIALLTLIRFDVDISSILGNFTFYKVSFSIRHKNIERFSIENPNETTEFCSSLNHDKNITLEVLKSISELSSQLDFYKLLVISHLARKDSERMIDGINIILSDGNKYLNPDCLSEGQKKQILIYFVTIILADKDSFILLDEPDSYIHVGNKEKIKIFLENFLKDRKEGEFILTTHSPALMCHFGESHIFDLENGKVIGKERREVLKNLVGDSMSYSEIQKLLNTEKDILIVEGKTDKKYIETALSKLSKDNKKYENLSLEYIFMGGTDGDILHGFSEQFTAKEGQKIIAFFDRDDSGINCICKSCGLDKKKFSSDTFKTEKIGDINVYFYPKKKGFTESIFEIEDYFDIETCRDFMFDKIKTFSYLKQKFKKDDFAEKCKEFDIKKFKGFEVLFNLILEIKNK